MASNNEDNSAASTALTDLERKIVDQVEYWFGDINLVRDKFIQEEMKKHNGWVPVKTLLTFNRMKTLTEDIGAIVSALEKSQTELIDLSEDRTSIRRSLEKPLPDNNVEYWQELKSRSIYAKGFPEDSTLDEIKHFFKDYGTVQNIVMRRMKIDKKEKKFKGSCFVLFSTKEEAKAFLALESVKFGEVELIRESQEAYYKRKLEEKRTRKEELRKVKETANKKLQQEMREKAASSFVPGCILHVEGLPTDGCSVRGLKDHLSKHGKLQYVDYDNGATTCNARFDGENAAKDVIEKMIAAGSDGKAKFGDAELTLSVLEGDEEKEYWKKAVEDMSNKGRRDGGGGRGRGRGRGRGGGGRGGGGRGGNRGAHSAARGRYKKFDNDGDVAEGPPAKRTKGADSNGDAHVEAE